MFIELLFFTGFIRRVEYRGSRSAKFSQNPEICCCTDEDKIIRFVNIFPSAFFFLNRVKDFQYSLFLESINNFYLHTITVLEKTKISRVIIIITLKTKPLLCNDVLQLCKAC